MVYFHAALDAAREIFVIWLFLAGGAIALATVHPAYRKETSGLQTILFTGIALVALGHSKAANFIAGEKMHLGIVPADIIGHVEVATTAAVVLWVMMAVIRRFT